MGRDEQMGLKMRDNNDCIYIEFASASFLLPSHLPPLHGGLVSFFVVSSSVVAFAWRWVYRWCLLETEVTLLLLSHMEE